MFVYVKVDRDNSGVPPEGERSGRHKESPPKKEMITLTGIKPISVDIHQ